MNNITNSLPENLNGPMAMNVLRGLGIIIGFISMVVFITTVSILCSVLPSGGF